MNPVSAGLDRNQNTRSEQVHLEDYWHVVKRRWWLIVLTTVVAVAGALWAAARSPQLYQASLTLQVGDPRGRTGQLGDIDVSPNLLWTDPIESELQQLSTQAIARYVVDTLQLRVETPSVPRERLLDFIFVDPESRVGEYELVIESTGVVAVESDGQQITVSQRAQPVEFDGVSLSIGQSAAQGSYPIRIVSRASAEARVTGGLAASVRPETNLIDVTYTGIDPSLAPRILNASAAALRALGVKRLRDWARSRTEFIQTQLIESGENLRSALEAVESFKENRGVTSLASEESRLVSRLNGLQSRLEELEIERGIYNRLMSSVGEADEPADIQRFAVVSTAVGSQAVQYYFDLLLELLEERSKSLGPQGKDPSHPSVVSLDRRIRDAQTRLLASTRQAAAGLDARMDAIQETIANIERELNTLPEVETELARLENQVEISSDMYKYLLSRYQESEIAEAEISPYVDVVDPATGIRPVGKGQRINVLFGALLGLVLGIGAAFFLEYLDRSIQSSSDLESALGLPVLGSIPEFRPDGDGRPLSIIAETDPEGLPAEAYRILRTNLTFSSSRETPLATLLFTSPGPGEGKSTTVANLGAVLAASGDRTLLIDADLRRGQQHEAFDLMRSPGLSDLLVGGIDAREAIRPSVRANLDILPAGQRPPNPSELLGSRTMRDLIQHWRQDYRWILLDAPPLLAVTDPAVLASQTDGAVVVIRAGETDRRAAWRAFQQLNRVNARVAGAVLNEMRAGTSADGYYADYYYGRAG